MTVTDLALSSNLILTMELHAENCHNCILQSDGHSRIRNRQVARNTPNESHVVNTRR
jgi:hypothetical protein